jgi:hypothetical protein
MRGKNTPTTTGVPHYCLRTRVKPLNGRVKWRETRWNTRFLCLHYPCKRFGLLFGKGMQVPNIRAPNFFPFFFLRSAKKAVSIVIVQLGGNMFVVNVDRGMVWEKRYLGEIILREKDCPGIPVPVRIWKTHTDCFGSTTIETKRSCRVRRVQSLPGSNLSPDTFYSDRNVSYLPRSLKSNAGIAA